MTFGRVKAGRIGRCALWFGLSLLQREAPAHFAIFGRLLELEQPLCAQSMVVENRSQYTFENPILSYRARYLLIKILGLLVAQANGMVASYPCVSYTAG